MASYSPSANSSAESPASQRAASSEDSSAVENGYNYAGVPISGLDLSGINWSQSTSINFQNPSQVYSATHGLGNSVYPASFGPITLNIPAWIYNNNDGIQGEGILTFANFQGKSKSHHLYRDLNTGQYFYVTRHGKNNGHGLEASTRSSMDWDVTSAANGLPVPPREVADATVGTDDSYESKSDPSRSQACVVFVGDPHLTREQYMNCVYPHFDNPVAKGVTLNSAAQGTTFLNQTYDNPNLTPNEDSENNNSPKSGATQNSKTNL